MEYERRTSSYRWPRRDEVCTWCRLTCLFSWRTRPRCRKVPGQRERRASRDPFPLLSCPLRPASYPSILLRSSLPSARILFSGARRSAPPPSPHSPSPPRTFHSSVPLICLCLLHARWRDEILEMRDSFIKGEKRCQRARDTTAVGRFDHTNYRDSSDATRARPTVPRRSRLSSRRSFHLSLFSRALAFSSASRARIGGIRAIASISRTRFRNYSSASEN